MPTDRSISRRSALSGGLAVSAGLTLAACSSGSDPATVAVPAAGTESAAESASPAGSDLASAVAGSDSASAAPESSAGAGTNSSAGPAPTKGGAAGGAIAKLSDIPVGSAIATTVNGSPVILAQPKAGTVVGFKNACTHAGCPVTVAGAKLNCPCHGSVFDAATGAVLNGPAASPLAKFAVAVSGQSVTVKA